MPDAPASPPPDVALDMRDDVGVITLRRPPHNLLTEVTLRRLADAVHGLPAGTRAAVVCSEGRSFCAGADFRSDDAPDPTHGASFETQTGAFYAQAIRIFESPVPLVAAVHGAAIGAGFGLALACDLCVIGRGGWFQANFVRLGIHPGFALSTTLPMAVGRGLATDIFLTGRRVHAKEARRIGIAQMLVPTGDELEGALDFTATIAGGAPLAVASTRATLRRGIVDAARLAMRHELAEQSALAGTADAVEGVNAMLEGREPRFDGR